jgi:hypothetical protein
MQGYLKLGKWDVYTEPLIYVMNPSSPAGPLHRRNVVSPSANLHTMEVTNQTPPTTDKKTGMSEHEGSTQKA